METHIVLAGFRTPKLFDDLELLLSRCEVTITPVTERLARLGSEAYQQSGKGSSHRARLDFGDCFSYALTMKLNEPLLFKGNDFVHTDVRVALPR